MHKNTKQYDNAINLHECEMERQALITSYGQREPFMLIKTQRKSRPRAWMPDGMAEMKIILKINKQASRDVRNA